MAAINAPTPTRPTTRQDVKELQKGCDVELEAVREDFQALLTHSGIEMLDQRTLTSHQDDIEALALELAKIRKRYKWQGALLPWSQQKHWAQASETHREIGAVGRRVATTQERLEQLKGKLVIRFQGGSVRFHEGRGPAGSFGEVKKVWLHAEGEQSRPMAMKLPTIRHSGEHDDVLRRFRREATIWRLLHHNHVNTLWDLKEPEDTTHGELLMLSPWADNEYGTATAFLQDKENCNQTLKVISDILSGLDYLHRHSFPVYHGDLKGNNVLIFGDSQNPVAKLTDFGLSKYCAPIVLSATLVGGNSFWTAPEIIVARYSHPQSTGTLTAQADIWAFGATAFELLTRSEIPFRDCKQTEMNKLLVSAPGLIDEEMTDYLQCIPVEIRGMIKACLSADPSGRPDSQSLKRVWHLTISQPSGIRFQEWTEVLTKISEPYCHYYPTSSKNPDGWSSWRMWMNERREERRGRYPKVKRVISVSS
ncbi:kinase-like protein [Sistotremastrum suecicum HHB10207 ss-3]|uniref:Kinase-like protein n=1 Tax=Sistotremastrum suecicum HHB10207 ss-3 TaxID=1314776 RepID=A0A166FWZ0_9AGAM|nr:kinase-like protein [Sistotremastrum suecicum HHB10207 ss-3]